VGKFKPLRQKGEGPSYCAGVINPTTPSNSWSKGKRSLATRTQKKEDPSPREKKEGEKILKTGFAIGSRNTCVGTGNSGSRGIDHEKGIRLRGLSSAGLNDASSPPRASTSPSGPPQGSIHRAKPRYCNPRSLESFNQKNSSRPNKCRVKLWCGGKIQEGKKRHEGGQSTRRGGPGKTPQPVCFKTASQHSVRGLKNDAAKTLLQINFP